MKWNTNAIISKILVLRSRCILHLSGEQGGGELHSCTARTSMHQHAVVAGEGAGAHLTSLTLLLKASVPLLTKSVFTLLATSRHKKMLTVFLTQLETGVTPIWVNWRVPRSAPRCWIWIICSAQGRMVLLVHLHPMPAPPSSPQHPKAVLQGPLPRGQLPWGHPVLETERVIPPVRFTPQYSWACLIYECTFGQSQLWTRTHVAVLRQCLSPS